MERSSHRPRVICHMMSSLDGRLVPKDWPVSPEGRRQYEFVHASYEADGWICGRINGGMLCAGLIDEVSVLVAPVVDARMETPALFDVDGDAAAPRRLALEQMERRADDMLWLRYRVE